MSSTHPGAGGSGAIKPAYLIVGADEGKIDAALSRLRARAEREGGPGALESFAPDAGQGPPDADALIAAIPSMSLMASRRYLLADGVERWTAKQTEPVMASLGALPPDLTVVLVARESPPKMKAPKGMAEAIEAAGGDVLRYQAPRARELPARLVAEASQRGFRLEPDAARLLVERLGESTLRLANELGRLAVWAGPEGEVTVADLEAMVADTSEEAAWTLSDAIVARDPATAIRAADRLAAQGEAVTPLTYQAARRLREAHAALLELEAGSPQGEVEARLRMHPYAAKMLMRRLRGASPADLRAATCAVADLEWWTRGGSEYPDDVALTLAVRRAAGAGAGAG
jgi:DNA polymerase III subunit delta